MIKLIFFCLFSLSFVSISFGCEVTIPAHLIIVNDQADLQKAIQNNSCSDSLMNELTQILKSVEGKISSNQLNEILSMKGHTLTIHPPLMQVEQFKHLVRNHVLLPPGIQVKSTEVINSGNYISLAPGDKFDIHCVGCLFGTGQILNVNIYGFDGINKALTVRADFKKMVRAYRLLTYMPSFTEISKDNLKEEYIDSIPHTDLLTNLDSLKFYKLNKPVKAGEILKFSDLNAIDLVKAGLKTEVIIENELVRLKTHGISRSNGSLGETVEVFHAEKNKKYQGKVIDINKVLVEL